MKANELRIGNLMSFNDGSIGHVTGLDSVNIQINGYYPILTIEPILLTEEWLLNFGFIKRNIKRFEHDMLTEYLDYSISGGFIMNGVTPHIYSVHELQNLYFALTGTELTIKP